MDAADTPVSDHSGLRFLAVLVVLVGAPLWFGFGVHAQQERTSGGRESPGSPGILPHGDGTRDLNNPDWSTDPADPFPMPPELAHVRLMEQTAEQAHAKSAGCV